MLTKKSDVFGIGQCSLDYLGTIDAFPAANLKCEFNNMTIQGGGVVATALVALTRWGVSSSFFGVIGDDFIGDAIKHSLVEEGVDISGLICRTNASSQFAFIVAEPGIGHRTIFWQRPSGAPLKADEVDLSQISHAKIVHTDGLFMEASIEACKTANEAGVPVVLDGGTLREGMLDIARLADHVIVSEPFARSLVGKDAPIEACHRLAELGASLVGVTLGARGYVALHKETLIQRPAYPVKPVDTTGCGDIFHAGYIYGLLQKWPIEKCLDFGAWAAAQITLKLGGRTGIPNCEDWERPGA